MKVESCTAMAVSSDSVSEKKGGVPSSPSRQNKSHGIRVVGGRIYDPINGKTCHQCRQKTRDFVAACKSLRKTKPCPIMFCHKCLLNRYGEKVEEVDALRDWSCPRCRGICNCSICMKKRGHQPTGILINTAKATGYSSVSEMLLDTSNQVTVVSQKKDGADSPKNNRKENSFDEVDVDLPQVVKNSKDVHKEIKRRRLEESISQDDLYAEIPLPMGSVMNSVSKIDVHTDDVGSALQFLEFCAVFRKILNVRKGQAEHVLQDLLQGRTGRRGQNSATAHFHIILLSILQNEQRAECEKLSASNRKNSWFHALKKYFSESPSVLKAQCLDSLEKASDYETLKASEKLSLLNILCDEVLATEKVRTWMNDQNIKHAEKVKEAKRKVAAAKDTEKSLKQKLKDAIIAKQGSPLSISEHEAIVSQIKCETEAAKARVLESQGMLSENIRSCEAVRIEPVFVGRGGNVYWKLKCSGNSDVLRQNLGDVDALTLNEKWFSIDDEGKQAIEKHICSSRGRGKRAKILR